MNKMHILFFIFAFAIQIGLSFGQERSFGKYLFYEFGAYGGAGIYNRDTVNLVEANDGLANAVFIDS